MSDYRVTVKRWDRGWELHIDGVGVTQARNLGEADAMVRDYVAIMEGDDAAKSAAFVYSYKLPAVGKFKQARKASDAAEQASIRAAAQARDAVADLVKLGLTGADMSKLLAVSPQRVSQLVAAARSPQKAATALANRRQVAAKKAPKSPAKVAAKNANRGQVAKSPKRGGVNA